MRRVRVTIAAVEMQQCILLLLLIVATANNIKLLSVAQ